MSRLSCCLVLMSVCIATMPARPVLAEESRPAAPEIKIARERVCPGTISPYQYGQFIEYLCAFTPSIFAEKVFDGSFEGVPEYKFSYRKEVDRLERPWYPDGAVHRGEFLLDDVNAFNGKVSQRISQRDGDPCTLGVSQDEKYVEAGKPLQCKMHLRSKGVKSPVKVALWGDGKTYAEAEFKPTERWQRFEATLKPTGTDAHATFTISFVGPGAIWIDKVSLMPADNVFGWRKDAALALRALKPGIIRFGGSTIEMFEWTRTIGDQDKRVPFTTCWGGLEPANAGLDEFLKLCKWVDAEPLICVRFGGKTPKDAADQVEYANGPATSPMGKLRAANGHAEPYGVKYWQIGNEVDDETYQKGVADFCKAMKAVDPSIKLLGAFPSPGLLKNAGNYLDHVCPHHYSIEDLKGAENDVATLTKMIAENAPGRNIRLGVTEWNTTAGDWGPGRGKLWTLDNALWCSRYHNMLHRHCDVVEMANRSNLADSFCCGVIQTNNHDLFLTPTYYAQQLYATHAGKYPLQVRVDGAVAPDKAMDVSATLSADEDRIAIFVVNPSLEAQKRTLDVAAFSPAASEVGIWTLSDTAKAGEREAVNSWREPQRIRTQAATAAIGNGKLVHEFPALSLTVVEISCKKNGG
jgi:alpha-L-arabinofuranosidase